MQNITIREALRDALLEEMEANKNIFILGEEVGQYQGAYKVTQGLLEKFGPKRVVDTPITEHGFTGLAVGAAFKGLKPIVEYMTFNFAMQAIDHIVNSAAKTLYMSGGKLSCPIVFRGPNGAALRVAAQHSQNYASWFINIPGLKVIAPYSAIDAKGLLKSAIRDPNPIIFLENEILYNEVFEIPKIVDPIPIGKGKIVRTGKDATIVTFSLQVKLALAAAEVLLKKNNIDVEIIDLRTIKPLDINLIIDSVKKTNRLLTIEEGWFFGGVGPTITALVVNKAFDYLDAPIENICAKDVPLPYAANLEKAALPSIEEIIYAVKKICYKI